MDDLEERFNQLQQRRDLEDAPDEPYMRVVPQDDELTRRYNQLLVQQYYDTLNRELDRIDNENNIRERTAKHLQKTFRKRRTKRRERERLESSRRDAIRELEELYPPMTSTQPTRSRIETGSLMPGRRSMMPNTIPHELHTMPTDIMTLLEDSVRNIHRSNAARRIQANTRMRQQRRRYNDYPLGDMYEDLWD
jgi:hypothetical protein